MPIVPAGEGWLELQVRPASAASSDRSTAATIRQSRPAEAHLLVRRVLRWATGVCTLSASDHTLRTSVLPLQLTAFLATHASRHDCRIHREPPLSSPSDSLSLAYCDALRNLGALRTIVEVCRTVHAMRQAGHAGQSRANCRIVLRHRGGGYISRGRQYITASHAD